MVKYLETPIADVQIDRTPPRYGMTVDGYTKRSGAPSQYRIRLEGEARYRRVMVLCFSNAASLFVRIRGEVLFINEYMLSPSRESDRIN